MIKAVIFDVGGTLHTQVKTDASTRRFRALVREVLSQHGVLEETDDETLFSAIDEGARRYKKFSEDHMTELNPDVIWQDYFLSPFAFEKSRLSGAGETLCCIFDLEEKEIIPREGLQETIQALQSRGLRLGILSNVMSRTMVHKILIRHGIADAFPYILQSSECKIRKPDPRIFVGDTISRDVRGANAAGWKIIQIDNPLTYHRDAAFRDMGYTPDARIYRLPEILTVLDRLAEKEG